MYYCKQKITSNFIYSKFYIQTKIQIKTIGFGSNIKDFFLTLLCYETFLLQVVLLLS
jgi:hypothetical protein